MLSSIRKISCKMILLALLIAMVGASLFGIQTPASAALPASTLPSAKSEEAAVGVNDVARLTAFMDGIMKVHMDSLRIPGAVISIVKDGKILLAKGYGHSNLKEGKIDTTQRRKSRCLPDPQNLRS